MISGTAWFDKPKTRKHSYNSPLSDSTTSEIAAITLRAHAAWKETRHSGIEETTADEGEHFTFTPYNQPVGTSSYLNIRLENAANSSQYITGRIGSDSDTVALEDSLIMTNMTKCIKRVVCMIPNGRSIRHIAHFAQSAFPCWSALQRFPENMRYIKSFAKLGKKPQRWIVELMEYFKTAGITIVSGNSNDVSGRDECDWDLKFQGNNASGWTEMPTLKYDAKGVSLLLNHNDYKWRKDPVNYFSKPSDMAVLQRVVLCSNYTSGVSKQPKIHVLILNREGSRSLSNGEAIVSTLQDSVLGDFIEVNYVQDMEGSLHHQALTMHSADIIIAPHGAQLTNLAFIKPCTVVAEIFPRGYYLQFFQSYVVAAGGIAFEGYEDGRSPYFDLFGLESENDRRARRSAPIPMSAASVVRALPEFILKFNTYTNPITYHTVNAIQEQALQEHACYAFFIAMTSRGHSDAHGSRGNFARIYLYFNDLKNPESGFLDLPEFPAPCDNKDAPNMLDNIYQFLGTVRGKGGTVTLFAKTMIPL
ncbi:unnamed protein product [Cylindrotheca closterium]|uniref:Glycosyltransferase 61 catalytic domain-containing protein n=1 Tax=Cylindrotheca closterium TaxID=2856 RepID=A0AAD2JHT5_9STRA|nr:unnamed protein product [Cylindrotheca closterium]